MSFGFQEQVHLSASNPGLALPKIKKCPWIIRTRFNAMLIAQRADQGLIGIAILSDDLAPPGANQVPGTRSQFIHYSDSSGSLAGCHRYLRPDGTVGGSGRPDPKWLRVGTQVWKVSHLDN